MRSLAPPLLALAAALLPTVACARDPGQLSERAKRERVAEMYQGYRKSFPDVPDITVQDLLAERDRVVVVDVRSAAERRVSMIPGAISSEQLEEHPERYRDRPIVTYCTIGYRSGLYAERLRREGWDAYNLAGSILAWTLAHQPLVDAHGPTRRVHVYGRKWNLAGDGYQTTW